MTENTMNFPKLLVSASLSSPAPWAITKIPSIWCEYVGMIQSLIIYLSQENSTSKLKQKIFLPKVLQYTPHQLQGKQQLQQAIEAYDDKS